MLNQKDIDTIAQEIKSNGFCTLYYLAHFVECREGIADEISFKSISRFRIIEVKCTSITNAYFEYLNYVNHPENYHIEEETTHYDNNTTYMHYYVVPNAQSSYTKDLNPRMPSLVYGIRRKFYKNGEFIKEYTDPTMVSEVLTNDLEYYGYTPGQTIQKFNNGELNWKYKRLEHGVSVGNVVYNYITSNWYILDVVNWPRTEKPLVNVNQKSAYFMDLLSAYSTMTQLLA